jgi:OmpA-OmpF porin, OOP family
MKHRFPNIAHQSYLGIFFTMMIPGALLYAQARQPYVLFEPSASKSRIDPADLAYADSIISFRPGSPGADSIFAQAQSACGAADGIPGLTDIHTVSLGCGGILELRLGESLIDSAGTDLVIFENGKFNESVDVFISPDLTHWTFIVSTDGGLGEIDIGKVVQKGSDFRYVRLVDRKENCAGPFAGADIDAVGAVRRTPPPSREATVFFSVGSHTLNRSAQRVIDSLLYSSGGISQRAFVIRGGTDRSGSDAYNRRLARRRGDAVIRYVRTRLANTSIEFRNEPIDPTIGAEQTDPAQQRHADIVILP